MTDKVKIVTQNGTELKEGEDYVIEGGSIVFYPKMTKEFTMTDDWTKDFEKLLKNIRFVDKTSFEEVPGDVQLKAFIAEQRERAREEEKRLWLLAITHLTSAQRESTLDTYEELNNMLGAAPTKE